MGIAQSLEKVRPALVRFLDDAESGLTAFAPAIFQLGKEWLCGISKRGSRYVRTLLIHGARAVMQWAERRTDTQGRGCARSHAAEAQPTPFWIHEPPLFDTAC